MPELARPLIAPDDVLCNWFFLLAQFDRPRPLLLFVIVRMAAGVAALLGWAIRATFGAVWYSATPTPKLYYR